MLNALFKVSLLLIPLNGLVDGRNTVIDDQVYPEVKVHEAEDAVLECVVPVGKAYINKVKDWEDVILWLFPNDIGIGPNETINDQYGKDLATMINGSLFLYNVLDSRDGIYKCLFQNDDTVVIRVNNVKLTVVPKLKDIAAWNRYENNFTVGFIAAGVALLGIVFLSIVYHLRYRSVKVNKLEDKEPLDLEIDSEKM